MMLLSCRLNTVKLPCSAEFACESSSALVIPCQSPAQIRITQRSRVGIVEVGVSRQAKRSAHCSPQLKVAGFNQAAPLRFRAQLGSSAHCRCRRAKTHAQRIALQYPQIVVDKNRFTMPLMIPARLLLSMESVSISVP